VRDDPASLEDIERVFGRYRPLVSSFGALTDALLAKRAPVVWAHPDRTTRDALSASLACDGVDSETVGWEPTALRLTNTERPGLRWQHAAGLFYVQDEASMLPVRLLDPQPGERVLDLCAAPGSKTARIAFALGNRGTLVANDRSAGRLAAMSSTIRRLGIRNVTCTVMDGVKVPIEAGRFDKVLVDAPCTAEGTAHKSSAWRRSPEGFRSWIPGLQRELLKRAIRLCRPGGRIVYSTCTLAPEENEAVVNAVLAELSGRVRLLPVAPIEGLVISPSVQAWGGVRFAPELSRAVRIWPHLGKATGFFMAVLEKDPEAVEEAEASTPISAIADDARSSDVLRRFGDDFGLPSEVFAGHRLLERGTYARLVPDDHRVPAGARHVATGLEVTRNRARNPKLSTAGGMSLGRVASKQVLQLSTRGAKSYQARESIPLIECEALLGCEHDGYVIVRFGEHALGLGRIVRSGTQGELVSEFPKAWSI